MTAHDVTDREFVVRRAYRINDALPDDAHKAPNGCGSAAAGFWSTASRARLRSLKLPDFDALSSQVSWYRDYAAYCGIPSSGDKVNAIVAEIGGKKPLFRKDLGKSAMGDDPDANCAAPQWDAAAGAGDVSAQGWRKIYVTVSGRFADETPDNDLTSSNGGATLEVVWTNCCATPKWPTAISAQDRFWACAWRCADWNSWASTIPHGKDRKRLITFVEIDRCATDAVAVVTGCRLGKRALKFRDWGKVAATFVDLASGKAIRVCAKESSKALARQMHPEIENKNQQQMLAYREMSNDDLFTEQWVKVVAAAGRTAGLQRRAHRLRRMR